MLREIRDGGVAPCVPRHPVSYALLSCSAASACDGVLRPMPARRSPAMRRCGAECRVRATTPKGVLGWFPRRR